MKQFVTTQAGEDQGPLEGIRVLDSTSLMSGPFCTSLLADMGAEIIKVEPPGGEHSRYRPPFLNGKSVHYAQINCGKKSLVLDLKSKAGFSTAFDLGLKSDVIVENWRPGVAGRLGLDYTGRASRALSAAPFQAMARGGRPRRRFPMLPSSMAASGFAHAQMEINAADKPPRVEPFLVIC